VIFRTFWTEQYDLATGVEKPRAGQGDERKQNQLWPLQIENHKKIKKKINDLVIVLNP
jgi:hypothetical protein